MAKSKAGGKASLSQDKLLHSIFDTAAISSHEGALRDIYYSHFINRQGVVVGKDVVGNVSAAIMGHPASPRVLLTAHMDEVGFIVTGFDDKFVKFQPVGGIDGVLLPGTAVTIHTRAGKVTGIFGRRPIHDIEYDEELESFDDMYIDIGAPDDLTVKARVSMGDVISWRTDFLSMGPSLYAGRAVDDKICVYIIMRVLDSLLSAGKEINSSVFGVLTPEEEVYGSSARCAANKINPTLALVLDVDDSGDYPDAKFKDIRDRSLSAGPLLGLGLGVNRKLNAFIESTAARLDVTLQPSVFSSYSGTVMEEIRTAGSGVPCAVLSVPVRYMHSPYTMFDMKVVDELIRLILEVCTTIDSIDSFVS